MANYPAQTFPAKIYQILEYEGENILRWNHNGTAFRIIDQARFEGEIIPKYFRHNRFSSVQRQLNLYGFKCITRGIDKGAFSHPIFRKGNYEEIRKMTRHVAGKKAETVVTANVDGSGVTTQCQDKKNREQSSSSTLQMHPGVSSCEAAQPQNIQTNYTRLPMPIAPIAPYPSNYFHDPNSLMAVAARHSYNNSAVMKDVASADPQSTHNGMSPNLLYPPRNPEKAPPCITSSGVPLSMGLVSSSAIQVSDIFGVPEVSPETCSIVDQGNLKLSTSMEELLKEVLSDLDFGEAFDDLVNAGCTAAAQTGSQYLTEIESFSHESFHDSS